MMLQYIKTVLPTGIAAITAAIVGYYLFPNSEGLGAGILSLIVGAITWYFTVFKKSQDNN